VKCSAAARENRGSARRAAYDAAVRGLLVLLMFAACYTPSIATGVACAPNGACPDGQTCAGTVCVLTGAPADAGTDADASSAGDRDGDSVMNANDNCPDVANTDQGDEDSDQIGDRCDLCPQLPGGSTADADGDAIGDACDPNPGVRDATWLFEGFHGSLPVWPGSNLWRSSTDSIRVAAAGEPAPDSEYLVLPLNAEGRTYDNYSTAITITVEQVAAGSEKGLGVVLRRHGGRRDVVRARRAQRRPRPVAGRRSRPRPAGRLRVDHRRDVHPPAGAPRIDLPLRRRRPAGRDDGVGHVAGGAAHRREHRYLGVRRDRAVPLGQRRRPGAVTL
jgi:hypothetical protein